MDGVRSVFAVLTGLALLGCSAAAAPRPASPSARAVQAGAEWLLRHQAPEGAWDPATLQERCRGSACAGPGEASCTTGLTGLALLALLENGPALPDGLQAVAADARRRACDWLIAHQGPDGLIGPTAEKYMYGHAVATLALARVVEHGGHERSRTALRRAVGYLVSAKNPRAGWRYAHRSGDTDSSVTGWCLLALRAARRTGLAVPRQVFDDAQAWYAGVTDDYGRTGYVFKNDAAKMRPVFGIERFWIHETLAALRILASPAPLPAGVDSDPGLELILRDPPSRDPDAIDAYYWFFGSAAVVRHGTALKGARRWLSAANACLLETQDDLGCAQGSWDGTKDRYAVFAGGRVYVTALNVLTLGFLDRGAGPLRPDEPFR